MKTLETVGNGLAKAISAVIAAMMMVMILNVGLAVLFRYVLKSSLPWSEELARYLMIWVAYLGCSLSVKEDSHIGLEMFTRLLPEKIRRLDQLLVRVVIGLFIAITFYNSFTHLKTLSIQRSSAMEIPMIFPYSSVTVGLLLMFIYNLLLIIKNFKYYLSISE